jgi:hypothetical protein
VKATAAQKAAYRLARERGFPSALVGPVRIDQGRDAWLRALLRHPDRADQFVRDLSRRPGAAVRLSNPNRNMYDRMVARGRGQDV